jgi:hypothetical protein
MRRNQPQSVDRASSMGDGEDFVRIEAVHLSPMPPGARHTLGGVDQDAIEVEEQGVAG